ncbi:MAG: HAD family hydrolase [Clostridia bacterium]|nr:HAD family hydrolase [Clostridia bacterium]
MRTLYVTDLDGTLLRNNETTSDFTNQTINELVQKGMLFSYATARSYSTSAKVTRGLSAKIPLIVYNGGFIIDNASGEILLSNFFGAEIETILDDLISNGVYPIVYAFVDGVEKFSYLTEKCTQGIRDFVATRKGDRRERAVSTVEELRRGEIFYLSCIGQASQLEPFFYKYRDVCHALYQRDIYSGEQWLEFMPAAASKSNAIRQLKELLRCNRLVVFGDGKNDVDMFEQADESYAVANAVDELKAVSTSVIDSNENDGVAKWLLENAKFGADADE